MGCIMYGGLNFDVSNCN